MAKNILPDVDLLNSREYYGAYNSKDLYKGKSFNMAGEWTADTHYFNDDFVVDFVSYGGALLSCKRSHQSSAQNRPELLTREVNGVMVPYGVAQNGHWTFVMGSQPGAQGSTGKVYIPKYNENSGELTWSLEDSPISIDAMRIKGSGIEDIYDESSSDGTKQLITIVYDGGEKEVVEIPHGKDGSKLIDVEQVRTSTGFKYIFKFKDFDGTVRNYSVDVENGAKGDKGDSATIEVVSVKSLKYGEVPTVKNVGTDSDVKLEFGLPEGPETPEFKLEYNKDGYDNLSVDLLWSSDNKETWTNLGTIGGKSPKLMRVLSTIDDPNKQDDTRRNDRIIWGYDGVDIDSWSTLCFLDDLRGDENIYIGTTPPMMPDGVTEDHDKIWFDPSDESMGEYSASDFLYSSYLEIGGTLSQKEFEQAFVGIRKHQFEIKFADSFESLPEPSAELINQLWYVPSNNGSSSNLFEEYIVVQSPAENTYMWEKWGSGSINVNLDNYYTKEEVKQYVSEEVTKVGYDGGANDDISEWE